MKDEAIELLEAIRADLQAAEAARARRASRLAGRRAAGMKRVAETLLQALGLPTLVLAVAVVLAPGRAALITHVYLVVVAAGALTGLAVSLARSLRTAEPSSFELGLRQPVRTTVRVKQLERLEREVTLGRHNAWDLHTRLRPTLRDTAAGLLAARHGVDLERQPERAASLLGAEAWELVAPGPARHREHRHAPGVDAAALDRTVSALERL